MDPESWTSIYFNLGQYDKMVAGGTRFRGSSIPVKPRSRTTQPHSHIIVGLLISDFDPISNGGNYAHLLLDTVRE